MPPTHSACLFANCKNLQMKSKSLISIGVSEAAHWTMWLRGKINASLSERSNSICRFGWSHSVFITADLCTCAWKACGSCTYSCRLQMCLESNVHSQRTQFYLFWAASVALVTSPERWRLRLLCYYSPYLTWDVGSWHIHIFNTACRLWQQTSATFIIFCPRIHKPVKSLPL